MRTILCTRHSFFSGICFYCCKYDCFHLFQCSALPSLMPHWHDEINKQKRTYRARVEPGIIKTTGRTAMIRIFAGLHDAACVGKLPLAELLSRNTLCFRAALSFTPFLCPDVRCVNVYCSFCSFSPPLFSFISTAK